MNEFHFLRPWWLAALPVAAFFVWRIRAGDDESRAWRKIIAPELLSYLLVGGNGRRRRFRPTMLLGIAFFTIIVALAGPTWRREPAPFADDQAALAIVIKVTPSMLSPDVQPTRLARAVEKVCDLLAKRPGAKTALFAYAGSAHRVMPLTTDAGVINAFAGELAPDIMPKSGSGAPAALIAADETIKQSGQAGWILWIADATAESESIGLDEYRRQGRTPVSVLAVAGNGPELDSLTAAAARLDAPLVHVTPDGADVDRLAHNARFSTVAEQAGGDRWRDFGYWLVWPVALVALGWFRRGYVLPTAGDRA